MRASPSLDFMDRPRQLDLLAAPKAPYKLAPPPQMDAAFLQSWKQRIADAQYRARFEPPAQQTALLDTPELDSDRIDPFALYPYPSLFYRLPPARADRPCVYFALDRAAPKLLLYVGETQHSNQRWKQVHDCKRYLERYIDLHRQYDLNAEVCIAFYWDVPPETTARRQLERALIQKWRSPFNKENWSFWGQPFAK